MGHRALSSNRTPTGYYINDEVVEQQQQEMNYDMMEDVVHETFRDGIDDGNESDDSSISNNIGDSSTRVTVNLPESWNDPSLSDFHDGFNVVHHCKMMVRDEDFMHEDADQPLFDGSPISKKEFCKSFQKFVAEEGLSDAASTKLLCLVKEWLPAGSNLPLHIYRSGNTKSFISSYVVTAEKRLLSFDCCLKGHCVFVGKLANSVHCSECNEERFYPCTNKTCKSNRIAYKDCPHSFNTRIPRSIIHYRPILSIIKDLLETKLFVKLLNYKHYNPRGNLIHLQQHLEQQSYSDIMDSALAIKHLAEMDDKWRSIAIEKTPINLLLGYNYDGCQPFGSKAVNFWPMTLTILNLPPNLRKKVGMGMFLLSIYYMAKESYVEDFLHRDCLVRELLLLYDGYELEVNDKIYFVQARLICHGYDTKGAEHVLRVQASGSLAGCPFCRLVTGSRRKWSGSVFYAGHRRLLDVKHFLRSRGQSQQCCPEEFYSANAPVSLDLMPRVSANWDKAIGLGFDNKDHERRVSTLVHLCTTSAAKSTTIRNFLRSSREVSPFVWHHQTYQPIDFVDDLYYYHMDYRDQVDYKRVANDIYINDGLRALRDKAPVNGVKGLWCFRYLPYADFATQVNWDPFHTLMNVAKNVISIWKGIRPVLNEPLLAYLRHTDSHPEVWRQDNGGIYNKWKIPVSSDSELNAIDSHFEALLVPKGYSGDFEVHDVFSQTGYMKGYTAIQFVEVLMDYFVYAVLLDKYDGKGYPKALMKFLVLLSEDFALLLSTNPFTDEDINNLFYRIVEVVELHQGLFPTSEALIIYHQLIDLPYQIKQLGPLRNWWTLAGERFMSTVKDSLPDGGRSYVTTVIRRHVDSELQKVKDYTNYDYYTAEDRRMLPVSDCIKHPLFPSNLFNIVQRDADNDGSVEQIDAFYCERISKLMLLDVKGSLRFNEYEFSRLLLFLVSEARNICGSFANALRRSPLFRLYCTFSQHKRTKLWTKDRKNKQLNQFLFWLKAIGCENGREAVDRLKLFNDSVVDFIAIDYNLLHSSIIVRGVLHQSDWEFSKNFTESIDYYSGLDIIYRKCIANGVSFISRGQDCRETKEMVPTSSRYGQERPDILPSNKLNLCLADHCGNSNDYSSWCRILRSLADPCNENEQLQIEEFEFGQLNFFFRCRLPASEIVLNDIPVASICVRKTERRGRNLFAVPARDDDDNAHDHTETTLKPGLLFCAVYNIFPSPIIVAAMDSDMRPVSKRALTGRREEVIGRIKTLFLIQMFRHRTIKFNPTFPNLATMQMLTSSRNDHR